MYYVEAAHTHKSIEPTPHIVLWNGVYEKIQLDFLDPFHTPAKQFPKSGVEGKFKYLFKINISGSRTEYTVYLGYSKFHPFPYLNEIYCHFSTFMTNKNFSRRTKHASKIKVNFCEMKKQNKSRMVWIWSEYFIERGKGFIMHVYNIRCNAK